MLPSKWLPGVQLISLGVLRAIMTPPGIISPFCCELTFYVKVGNVFNFQLQPLDIALSLSARWNCVALPFGVFAQCKYPPGDLVPT